MIRRSLIVLVVVLLIIVGGLAAGDVFVRERVQDLIASRIEKQVPGSHAVVRISSFPFIGRLAVAGSVPGLQADVTGVTEGRYRFATVDVSITDLKVQRTKLLEGSVDVASVKRVGIVATMTQQALDETLGLPIVLGPGTVGIAGTTVAAAVSVVDNRLHVGSGRYGFELTLPALTLLPCVSGATIDAGVVELTCVTSTVPSPFTGQSLSGS